MDSRRLIPALLISAALVALTAPSFAADHNLKLAAAQIDSPIIVTEPRWATDEMINRGVVDALESDPRLAGRIGVETTDGVVELSGIVTTGGQSLQAERDAKAVYGVRNVHNTLATRMGGGRY